MSILDKIKGFFENTNTLYYPGCITKFVYKDLLANYRELLNKAGVDFIELKDLEKCCGSPVINAGYKKDYQDLIEHNKKVMADSGVKKIITNCPACYKVLKENYPELEVEHAVVTLFKALAKKKIVVRKLFNENITYHDPCHLGRHSGIYEEPRVILETLGFKIEEMSNHHENSLCCGAGAGLQNNYKEVADKITRMRLEQAGSTKAKMLVTACPMCYHQLKKNSKGLKIAEISEVLLNGIK
ncbi:MAG: (Fe-S)-binding protein [Nanoarchaeota archaeon]|nr:(Fe-S)-binding protein [Nanoarchaeota archaeon]